MGEIRQLLTDLGLVSTETIEIFAHRTRDAQVPVYRDSQSGVIFIDDYYVGDETYSQAEYRSAVSEFRRPSRDTKRRLRQLEDLVTGKRILDFGCGTGEFLCEASSLAETVVGVELDDLARNKLNDRGITCVARLSDLPDESTFDFISLFHVLEHLPNPVDILRQLRQRLSPDDGIMLVEVPHARDYLLTNLHCHKFRDFTLWSQHLILHTRDSLSRVLRASGFPEATIMGVQRYGPLNHHVWLSEGKPGGHLRSEAVGLETPEMLAAYENALQSLDLTDSLLALSKRRS